jgi:imidazolonepropionase-like amidohydrolase
MKNHSAVLIALALLATPSAYADTVVVTADRMLDVIAGRVVERPQVTIKDGRITSVTSQATPVADDVRHVDLPGMTLLPGLIDMHVHLTSDPLFSGYRHLEFTDNFWTVVGWRTPNERSRQASPLYATSVPRTSTMWH